MVHDYKGVVFSVIAGSHKPSNDLDYEINFKHMHKADKLSCLNTTIATSIAGR